MPGIKVTAQDVARKAGVSQPTVSRVFSRGANVTAALRKRVESAAEELGYRPNTLARSLITGKSRTIGVVVAYMKNPFFSEALEHLSHQLREQGYHVLLLMAANRTDEVDPLIEDLLAHQVDGIVLMSTSMSNRITDRLLDLEIPFVMFNRGQQKTGVSNVTSDNFEGGRTVARFLVAGGHHRIAHVAGWQNSLNGHDRQMGFLKGLEEHGHEAFACVDSHFRRRMAIDITRDLFDRSQTPDAIFVGNDYMAFGVMEALREMQLRIPQDVSVVGYDDVAMAAWDVYSLTTMRQPIRRMVAATCDALVDKIEQGKTQSVNAVFDSELVVRRSARLPAKHPDY